MNNKQQIAAWRSRASQLDREGRPAQALLLRNVAWEAENGCKWLELMREDDNESTVLLDGHDDGGGKEPHQR